METNIIEFSKERTYLIMFIKKVLRKETKENILLTNKFKDQLCLLLKKAPKDYIPKSGTLKENQIRFEIPNRTYINTRYNYYISEVGMKVIEKFIYKYFWHIYEQHMMAISKVVGFKIATELFMDFYDIDVLKFDMLIRRDRRMRISNIPKKTSNLSSLFIG